MILFLCHRRRVKTESYETALTKKFEEQCLSNDSRTIYGHPIQSQLFKVGDNKSVRQTESFIPEAGLTWLGAKANAFCDDIDPATFSLL